MDVATLLIEKPYRPSLLIFVLIAITTLVYIPTLSNEFQLAWDDWWVVMNDYTDSGWTYSNIWKILTEFYHGQYAPINELFYLSIFSWFGYDALYFHLGCLLIHIFNVYLVFKLCQKIFLFSSFSYKKYSLSIAFLAALLFGINPINVEAVSWIAASKCILFASFYLLSVIFYISYLTTKSLVTYMLVVLLFILSFGSKEQAVTLPGAILLIDYLYGKNLKVISVYYDKIPLVILALGFGVITMYSQQYNGEGVLSNQQLHPWYQNIVFATYSIVEYGIKCVLPVRLSYIYPFPNLPSEPLPMLLWIYPFLLLSPVLVMDKIRQNKLLLFGVVFFLVQVLVVANIIPTSRFAIIADRYVYLGSIGITSMVAFSFVYLLRKYNPVVVIAIYGIYFIGMAIYTNQRIKVWHDSKTLKKEISDTLRKRPDYEDWLKTQK